MQSMIPLYGFGGTGASLTVTAPAGATVTVSKDGKTKTTIADSTGVAAFEGLTTYCLYYYGNEYTSRTGGILVRENPTHGADAVKNKDTIYIEDMRMTAAAFAKLPPGQLKKILTGDIIAILSKYGMVIA